MEKLYFCDIMSKSHTNLQFNFIQHWDGDTISEVALFSMYFDRFISALDEYDPMPLALNEERQLEYPPSLQPKMLQLEKNLVDYDSHQLEIGRSECGSKKSANTVSSRTSANEMPTTSNSSP
jgi:hypothetical protein